MVLKIQKISDNTPWDMELGYYGLNAFINISRTGLATYPMSEVTQSNPLYVCGPLVIPTSSKLA